MFRRNVAFPRGTSLQIQAATKTLLELCKNDNLGVVVSFGKREATQSLVSALASAEGIVAYIPRKKG